MTWLAAVVDESVLVVVEVALLVIFSSMVAVVGKLWIMHRDCEKRLNVVETKLLHYEMRDKIGDRDGSEV